ncbi:MAG: TlpA family protein disulfide reductase [Deltaproteobacteria bacterium]|nr:TlpA family protein disulfide reductase [Deltaproteobacteria bacterium]
MRNKPKRPSESKGNSAIVILAVLLGLFAMAILPRILEQSHPMVGKPMPALTLPSLGGAPKLANQASVSLESLKGKVVVLDFWAPWCGPCRHEMPILDKLAKRFELDGVVVLGVLVDPDHEGARNVLAQLNIAYPQLDDDAARNAAREFNVSSLPTMVVVDKTGTIRSYRTGFSSEEDVENAIKRALGS